MSARVLVVDDEADFLATYVRLRRRQGYEVTTVSLRATALAAVTRERPALSFQIPDFPMATAWTWCARPAAAPIPHR